ncbi:MAG: O-Antigen ligase [Rhizorhabdus sp.]|nr:O-Antigen ligase [Rhizorhabdus sp.]
MLGMFIWAAHLELMVGIGIFLFYASLSSATRLQMGLRPAILALGMPPIAFILPKLALLHIVYLMIVPMFAARRNQVVPIYVFALLLLPDFNYPLKIGSLFLFYGTIYDSLGFGALLTMVMRFPARGRIRPASDVPFLLMVIVLMFGRSRDESFTNALRVLMEIALTYGLPYYIGSRGVRTIDDVKRVMLYMVCAAVMISTVMCYEALRTWPMYRILYSHYGVELLGMVKLRSGWLRATGTSVEATSMAFVLVPCFLAAICSRRAFASYSHYIGILGVLAVGLFLPQSRGALVGLMFGATAMGLYLRRRAAVGGVAFLAIAVALAMLIVPANTKLGGMLGKSADTASTADYRKDLLRRGMEEIGKRPLIGASGPAVRAALEDLRQGEGIIDFVNTYLYIGLVTGLIGLAAFAGGFIGQPLALWRIREGLPQRGMDAEIAALLFAGILAPMEMLAFTSLGGRPATMIIVFIGLAAAVVSGRRYAGTGTADALARPPVVNLAAGAAMPLAGEWREPFPKDVERTLR